MLFFAALPDLHRDLFIQQIDNLQKFECFSKLSPEIRRMIWRECYPKGRKIQLYLHRKKEDSKFHPPLPVTLHINQDSRSVTITDYLLMWPNTMWGTPERKGSRPICLNPTRDIASFNAMSMMNPYFITWLAVQRYSNPRLFDRIEHLEVICMYWGESWRALFERKKPGLYSDQCGGAL